jgi:hypothetical protein
MVMVVVVVVVVRVVCGVRAHDGPATDADADVNPCLKLLMHGEFQGGKTFDIECIYQFTLVEHDNSHKIKAIGDFVDSAAFAGLGGGE